jgi:hypothetical protein
LIKIEQISGRKGKRVEVLDEGLEGVDTHLSLSAISDAVDLPHLFCTPVFQLLQKEGKTAFSFPQNDIINKRACQYSLRITAGMRPSHNYDPLAIPLLDNPGDLQCLPMIRREGRRDPKDIGLLILKPPADLRPPHAKMVIPGIELIRASVIKGIILLQICKLRGNRDGPFLFCLTVEDLNGVPMRHERGSEIGKTDRLPPHRSTIKIADRRLDEKDFHDIDSEPTIAYGKVKPSAVED